MLGESLCDSHLLTHCALAKPQISRVGVTVTDSSIRLINLTRAGLEPTGLTVSEDGLLLDRPCARHWRDGSLDAANFCFRD